MKRPFFKYSDLFLVFLWRHFSIRYRQSMIGIGWAVFQPLSMTVVFVFIFNRVMPVHMASYPSPLFFYTGLILWSFFSASLMRVIPCLPQHYNLITKVFFPTIIIPVSSIIVVFLDLLISFVILVLWMIYYKIFLTITAFWFIGLLFLLVAFTIGVGLFLCAINVFFRDIQIALAFLIQLWFFVTPVFYSIAKAPSFFKVLLFINPVAFVIENARLCLIEGKPIVPAEFLFMLLYVLTLLYLSFRFYSRMEKDFADVI